VLLADAKARVTRKQPIDRFDALVDRPIEWQVTAATYIAAANYLFEVDRLPVGQAARNVGSNWPVMLLYATAAENLLKAIRIAQGEPVVVGGKLAEYYSTHNLLRYADDAGVPLAPQQRSLTVKLEHVLEAGKYPVAKGPGRSAQAWTWDNPGDVKAVWRLLQRIDDALRLTGTQCLDRFDVDKLQYARH
jgi:hypothetical protein